MQEPDNRQSSPKISYSEAKIPFRQKISQLSLIFWIMLIRILTFYNRSRIIFSDLEEYNELMQKYAETSLKDAKVFEIGHGTCPRRLITMVSLGIDAFGVDSDVPILSGKSREFVEIFKKNGFERALKSIIIFVCFEWTERRRLAKELKRRGYKLKIVAEKFLVQEASEVEIPDKSLDLIISEDVFEHIPVSSLEALVSKMARWLKHDGVALIRPNIFTGILGGHLIEWHISRMQKRRRKKSEPWEHLRKNRFRANTYLNQLSRADYRDLFSAHFDILEERVRWPNLGKEFLAGEVLSDLKDYTEDELFSNRVLFVLKPKIT